MFFLVFFKPELFFLRLMFLVVIFCDLHSLFVEYVNQFVRPFDEALFDLFVKLFSVLCSVSFHVHHFRSVKSNFRI